MLFMWPTTQEELISIQNELGEIHPEPWEPIGPIRLIGGCFICYPKSHAGKGTAGDRYWAAAVCLIDNQPAAVQVISGETTAPYEPGLLALREGPLLESALRKLPAMPEVLLVNATGRDHPRRAGLALHLGWYLSLPTIGVTRNPLIAEGDWPANLSAACAPLQIGEEIVGYWLRTKRDSPPLAVHGGWRTSPETAVRVISRLKMRWRTPEPLRQARQAARQARANGIRN
jgi:deoxyribonuclease V